MSKNFGAWVVIGALLACPTMGYAADMGMGGAKYTLSLTKDYTASPWTHEMGWSNRAVNKLGFGAKNLLLGWTELVVQPKDAMSSGGNFFTGLGKGVVNAVGDTLGGAAHLVTFPITAVEIGRAHV